MISLRAVKTIVLSMELQSSRPSRMMCVIFEPSTQEVKKSAISSALGDELSSKKSLRAGSTISRSPLCWRYCRHREPSIVFASRELSFYWRASQKKKQRAVLGGLLCCTRRSSSTCVLWKRIVSSEDIAHAANSRKNAFTASHYGCQSERIVAKWC